jgi:hypothetical protein
MLVGYGKVLADSGGEFPQPPPQARPALGKFPWHWKKPQVQPEHQQPPTPPSHPVEALRQTPHWKAPWGEARRWRMREGFRGSPTPQHARQQAMRPLRCVGDQDPQARWGWRLGVALRAVAGGRRPRSWSWGPGCACYLPPFGTRRIDLTGLWHPGTPPGAPGHTFPPHWAHACMAAWARCVVPCHPDPVAPLMPTIAPQG